MLGLLWWGCAAGPAPTPCEAVGADEATIVPAGADDFVDGDALPYGRPPQGGSPYSPYRVGVGGLEGLGDGASVRLEAYDLDEDLVLGDTTYELRLVCANVGDNAGRWVGSDLHQRFDGFELEDLDGRNARVTATVTDLSGNSVAAWLEGVLTPM